MPKDTKSLGNNKAPACESRGFVRKKQKVCILTHLHTLFVTCIIQPGELLQTDKRLHKYHSQYIHLG